MNVIPFFDKAIENLEIAEICFERGKYNACANRAYYAMYHAALAALAHEGIKPTQDIIKHGWMHSTFHKELINTRKLYPTLKSALLFFLLFLLIKLFFLKEKFGYRMFRKSDLKRITKKIQ